MNKGDIEKTAVNIAGVYLLILKLEEKEGPSLFTNYRATASAGLIADIWNVDPSSPEARHIKEQVLKLFDTLEIQVPGIDAVKSAIAKNETLRTLNNNNQLTTALDIVRTFTAVQTEKAKGQLFASDKKGAAIDRMLELRWSITPKSELGNELKTVISGLFDEMEVAKQAQKQGRPR